MQDGNNEEYIEAEPQQTTSIEENQIEVPQQETQVPQLLVSPLHNVPIDQLRPEFEFVTEPQVSSAPQNHERKTQNCV